MENSYNDDPLGILSKPKQKQAAPSQEGGNDPLGILKKKADSEPVGTPSASGTPPTSPSKSSSSSVSAPPPVIEVPTANNSQAVEPAIIDPIDASLEAGKLSDNPIAAPSVTGGTGGAAPSGGAFDAYGKNLKEQQEKIKGLQEKVGALGFDANELYQEFKDFPKDAFNSEAWGKAQLLQLRKDNPVEYQMRLNNTKNQYSILDAAYKNEFDKLPDSTPNREAVAKAAAVHTANIYNRLNEASTLSELYPAVQQQKEIIFGELSGGDKQKALQRLQQSITPVINPANPELLDEYNNSPLKNAVTPTQFAALKVKELLYPESYKATIAALQTPYTAEYVPDGGVDYFTGKVSFKESETPESVNTRKGFQLINKQLSDEGRYSLVQYANRQIYNLNQQIAAAPEEERPELAARVQKFASMINGAKEDAAKDETRYPLVAESKYDDQVKELLQNPGMNPVEYAVYHFGKGLGKPLNSIENIATNIFGSDQDNALLQIKRRGESATEQSEAYLPESLRYENSPVTVTFSKKLQQERDKVLADPKLSDAEKHEQLTDLVKNNQQDVQYITNPEAGKTKNFLSAATLYSNAGMIGDIGAFAAQSAGLGLLGAPAIVSNAAPLFLSSQDDFYKQGIAEGVDNPAEYANVHAIIMAAAGLINPKLDIVKRVLGAESVAGRVIAGLDEKEWQSAIEKNAPLLEKFVNSATAVTKEAAKMAAVWGAGTSVANDLSDKYLFNKDISAGQIADHAASSVKNTLVSSIALFGVEALTNFRSASPNQKSTLWQIASTPESARTEINDAVKKGEITQEQANDRLRVVNELTQSLAQVPNVGEGGKPLTDAERMDTLYKIFLKSKGVKDSELVQEPKTQATDDFGYKEKIAAVTTEQEKEQIAKEYADYLSAQQKTANEPKTEQPLSNDEVANLNSRKAEIQSLLASDAASNEKEGQGSLIPEARKELLSELEGIKAKLGAAPKEEAAKAPDDTHLIVSSDTKSALASNRKKQVVVEEDGKPVVKEEDFTQEDAEVELDRLEFLAEKGRLTPEQFQKSYFGQVVDLVTSKAASERIKTDAKGFIADLRKSFEAKDEQKGNHLVPRETLIGQARELVRNSEIKGYTSETIKDAAENDPAKFEGYLENIAEQAKDPGSRAVTLDTYGKDIVDLAERLSDSKQTSKNNNVTLSNGEQPTVSNRLSPEEKRGNQIGGSELQAASDAVGRISDTSENNKASVEELRDKQGKELEQISKNNGTWVADPFKEFGNVPQAIGSEHNVYLDKDGQTLTKLNSAVKYDTWQDYLDNLAIHNTLFPTEAYTLKGFTDLSGDLAAVVQQPVVRGKEATFEQVKEDMTKMGFEHIPPSENPETPYDFVNKKTGVVISDLHGENVLVDANGKLRYIDTVIKKKPVENEATIPPTKASTTDQGTAENSQGAKEATKFENPEEAVKHINSLPLSHVEGTRMGAKQAEGIYLSTEDANRYSSESNLARSVTVDIKNPKVTDYVENTNLQHEKIGQLLDANEVSASDISSEYRPELEKFAGKRDVTNEDVSNWYRSKEGSRINEDYFEQTVRTKAAKLITEQYKSEGHDALYIPATKNTEGELIVFDSNAVKFEPANDLSKEQKYTTKTGKYSVEYRDGKRVVVDKQGNVLPEYIKVKAKKGVLTDKEGHPRMVEQRNKVRDNVLREHDKEYKYNFGAKANTEEMPTNISDEQASSWVIQHSSNPAEVASVYASTPKETAKMTEIEQAIADNGIGKVKTKSYKDFGDKNNMTASKAKTYLNDKTGRSIDEIARELSDHTGLEITPQDIVDFMDRFPNGDAAVLRDGSVRQLAATRFEELTGIPLNDRVATQAAIEHYAAAEREAIERDLPNEMPDEERQNWLTEIADNEYPTDNFSEFIGEPTEATGQDKSRPEIMGSATENTGTEMAGRPATSTEQGRLETADSEGENGPPAEEGSKPISVGDSDLARLMHEDTEATREEMGLMEKRTPKEVMKDERARQEADNLINSGADFRKIAQRVLDGDGTLSTVEQVAFAKIVKAMKERQNSLDPTSAEFKDMQRDIEHLMKAADMSGSVLGEQFRARQIESPYDDSMADWVLRVKEAKGVDDLSDEVLKKTKSQHNKYEDAKKNDQDTSAEVDASFSEMQADKAVKNEASKPKRQRKSKEQYGSERDSIKNSIRDKWNQQGNMGDVISSGPGAVFSYAEKLTRISPDVAKLVKSYVEEGVTKLQDVIDRIHADLKTVIPEVTKDDTRDLIAGVYRESKATRNELAAKARELQTQAELLRKLEKLENGTVPSSQKAKDRLNQEIADLRKKIKDHGATKLADVIKRNDQTLKNIRQRIADKDYAPDPPAPALENPEFKRKFPELYKRALDAKLAVDDARHEFDIEVRKAELEKQSLATTAISHVGKTFRTFKALKAGIDLSAVGVQNGLAILANPVAGVKSLVKSFAAIGSNRIMDRQLARIHNSEYYDLMVKSGLSVVEPKSLKAQERDEFFADTYFDQMKVKVRGKTYDLAFTKPFERQFTALGNEMRVNLFLRRAQQLMEQGYTFANNPKEFKDAATVINTMTGRGNLAEGLSKHNSLLTTVFWSPRLMASSLNVVGLGELAWAGRLFGKETRGYYTGLTKKQAAFAVGQTIRGIGMGIAIMAAIKLFNNGEGDDDPRSSTFGNVKIGDYSYNIFGRYTSFVRAFVRMLPEAMGGGKKGVEGSLKTMKPNDYAREAIQLVRGKLNPTTGLAWTMISRTDYSGHPVDYKKEFWGMFTPMSIDEISQGVKEDGAASLLKRGLPSIIGVKVTNDKDYTKKKK